jgi:hypothetical protein
MRRSATFGQWPFYVILAIVILFLSQTLLQANAVGMRELTTAFKTFTQQMATFKQRRPVIQANEDSNSDAEAIAIRVGMREITTAYKNFAQQMVTFTQRTPVIQANEDPDAGMLKIVRQNLDAIHQILKTFEPIRDVVDAPEMDTAAYRETIHKLTVLLG